MAAMLYRQQNIPEASNSIFNTSSSSSRFGSAHTSRQLLEGYQMSYLPLLGYQLGLFSQMINPCAQVGLELVPADLATVEMCWLLPT
jgi:hypothetical protein